FPYSSSSRAEFLDGLALDLTFRYALDARRDDLNAAIVAWQTAVTLPASSAQYGADYRVNLAKRLQERFSQDKNRADQKLAMAYLREALAMLPAGSERHAFVLSCVEEAQRAVREPAEAPVGEESQAAAKMTELLSEAQQLYDAAKYLEAAESWREARAFF